MGSWRIFTSFKTIHPVVKTFQSACHDKFAYGHGDNESIVLFILILPYAGMWRIRRHNNDWCRGSECQRLPRGESSSFHQNSSQPERRQLHRPAGTCCGSHDEAATQHPPTRPPTRPLAAAAQRYSPEHTHISCADKNASCPVTIHTSLQQHTG